MSSARAGLCVTVGTIFLSLLLLGCGGPPVPTVGSAVNVESEAVADAPVTSVAPVISFTVAAPTAVTEGMPSFELIDVTPTEPPAPEQAKLAPAPATAVPTQLPAATETATPEPTFTPPALPGTSPNEHYWLRRPIAEGGTVWTDKAYPYGSTRGGTLRPHHGVEFYVPQGTEILAAASGTVRVAGDDSTFAFGPHTDFYGNVVVIELDTPFNDQPVYNLYGHLSQILVTEGQRVDAQEVIALSGATGVADGAHLHFEVRVGQNSYGSTRNPLLWLYPFPEHGTVAGRVTWANGALAHEAPVFLRRIDAPSKYAGTTTYANADEQLNADDGWNENFTFDDVAAGYYQVEVAIGEDKFKQEVWVYPYQTSFVEIVLD